MYLITAKENGVARMEEQVNTWEEACNSFKQLRKIFKPKNWTLHLRSGKLYNDNPKQKGAT